jgi:hypothetical protein
LDLSFGSTPGAATSLLETRALSHSDAAVIPQGMGASALLVSEALREALERVVMRDYVLIERVILIHAPGTRFPSSKLDYLAVTPFGVFDVMAMRFHGRVSPGSSPELVSVDEEGEIVSRTSPARRQVATRRCLRSLLRAQACPVEALAVPAFTDCVLDPLLPESIMELRELYHYLRVRMIRFRCSGQRMVNLNQAVDAIGTRLDTRPQAFDEHRARVVAHRATRR